VFPISFFFRSTPTSTAQELKRQIKVLMFGPYGTVVDMPKGLTEIATPFLKAKGWCQPMRALFERLTPPSTSTKLD
jgi:hypothetical protein